MMMMMMMTMIKSNDHTDERDLTESQCKKMTNFSETFFFCFAQIKTTKFYNNRRGGEHNIEI